MHPPTNPLEPPQGNDTAIFEGLPPAISFYLRKLVRQNLDRLEWIQPPTDGGSPQEKPSIDPTGLFERLWQQGTISDAAIPRLERLVNQHQELLMQGVKSRRTLNQTEQEILAVLGLRLTTSNADGTILIVDDTPGNLRLLSAALVQQGYEVRNAINGSLALSGAKTIKPDLILLDIMMPGMDGYEVCRRLKQDPQTQDIPVIFISAIDGVVDKVKAFDVGGVDYVSKPFQIEEVLARIEHQLKIWNLQRRLEEQNLRLQQDSQDRKTLEQQAQQLWDNSTDGLFRSTPDGTFKSVNQTLATLLGYQSPHHLLTSGANTASFYVQPGRHREFVAQMQQFGQISQFESEVRKRDGTVIWIQETAQAIKAENGELLFYAGQVQDITQLKTALEERDTSRQRIRRLLLSLFPKQIAKQFIRDSHNRFAQYFPQVTLLSVQLQQEIPPNQDASRLIEQMNQLMQQLERLADLHHFEYLRPMAQGFLVATGIPIAQTDHADAMVRYALALRQQQLAGNLPLPICLGIHSGPILAGIIGAEKRFSYELYGPTLEVVQQLARHRNPEQILVSAATQQVLRSTYALQQNSTIPTSLPTYWL